MSNIDEALESIRRVRERARPELRDDVETFGSCLRAAVKDPAAYAEFLRGFAALAERHAPQRLAVELRRIARRQP